MAKANDNHDNKAIRLSIVRMIRQRHPEFPRLKRNEKRKTIEKIANEVIANFASDYVASFQFSQSEIILARKFVSILTCMRIPLRVAENPTRQTSKSAIASTQLPLEI